MTTEIPCAARPASGCPRHGRPRPATLAGFCDWLRQLSNPALAEELGRRLRFRMTQVEWARYFEPSVAFSDGRYHRAELTALPGHPFPFHQVLLLCWREGQASAIHDHGGSVCAVRVLVGTARETVFEPTPEGRARPVAESLYRAGDVTCRAAADLHRVEAVGGPLVSLHVYPRDLGAMKVYHRAG